MTARHDGDRSLRVALLAYRAKPHCGGQGVYIRNLSRELVGLGHHVEVIAGPPYPELDDGAALTRLPSLDLYREPDPFRIPGLRELRTPMDWLELSVMLTGGFPEPLTFSLRAWRELRSRRAAFDVVHDNQSLGYGLLGIAGEGLPTLATIHHPISVDRRMELADAGWRRRLSLRRWYGFVRMQARVARRLPRVVTVSRSSRADIADDLGVAPARMDVVPVGVDPQRFRPPRRAQRVPGRVVTTASADVPMKGVVPLLEAIAKVRTEQDVELVIVGRPRPGGTVERAIARLDLAPAVRFVHGVSERELVDLLGTAEAAVVPSLYEGFSLPAVEAMACGTPLVATTGGALPEVVGADGEAGLLVPPGDVEALALALRRLLDEPGLRARLGAAGRARVLGRFTWRATAVGTAAAYRRLLGAEEPQPC